MNEPRHESEKALEQAFFDEKNGALLDRGQTRQHRDARREQLAHACGVTDEKLLDRLMDVGVGPKSLAALVLVPLVTVAWADRDMAISERRAILGNAAEFGIERGSAPHELLDRWLRERPPDRLFEAWRDYVEILWRVLDPQTGADFAAEIMRRAGKVSDEGARLGASSRTGAAEKAVLERLKAAFELPRGK